MTKDEQLVENVLLIRNVARDLRRMAEVGSWFFGLLAAVELSGLLPNYEMRRSLRQALNIP